MTLFLIVALGLLAGIAFCLPRLNRLVERRTQEALRVASLNLGLKREPYPRAAPGAVPSADVHTGLVEGIPVLVGASLNATVVASPFGSAIPRAPVTAVARLPTPLGCKLRIARPGFVRRASLRLGDRSFDRCAEVSASDEPMARELLASAMLRRSIRLFLERGPRGHAVITDTVVVKNVLDAPWTGHPAITGALLEVAALAKALDRRERIRRLEVTPTDQDRLEDLLIARLEKALPGFELRISVGRPLRAGIFPREARGFADWLTDADFLSLETPPGFPRQAKDAVSPDGLVGVAVECDEGGFHDSRNTWYSYHGYYLTMLVFGDSGEIWDARWERTD